MRAREKKGRKLYGAKKMWRELNRDGIEVARCTVERLMREMGLEGLRARKKRPRTTVPGPAGQERPSDLLERVFSAPAPNRRWVADITYIETSAGFVYAAFILDLGNLFVVSAAHLIEHRPHVIEEPAATECQARSSGERQQRFVTPVLQREVS